MTRGSKGKGVRNCFPRPLGQYSAEHRRAGDGCQPRLTPSVRPILYRRIMEMSKLTDDSLEFPKAHI